MIRKMKTSGSLMAITLLIASQLHASTSFVVDFGSGTQSSTSTANNISTINTTSSITVGTDGSTLSGISLTTSGFLNSLSGTAWTGGNLNWVNDALGDDYFRGGSIVEGKDVSSTLYYVATVTITGLAAGNYSVQLCSASSITSSSSYSIEDIKVAGSGSATFATGNSAGTTGTGNNGDDWNTGVIGRTTYLIWASVYTSTGTITITITDTSTLSNNIFLNGIYVASVPEPAQTSGIFGALVLGGAWLIRRKRVA
jgi:MYXO-CTERM domain-containing protein